MTQGRMVSEEMQKDSRLHSMSMEASLVFMKALPHLDRKDRISGHPVWIAVHVIPSRSHLHDKLPSIIDEWVASGLVMQRADGMLEFVETDWHWHPDEDEERRNG
jgi:hypothetical protein